VPRFREDYVLFPDVLLHASYFDDFTPPPPYGYEEPEVVEYDWKK